MDCVYTSEFGGYAEFGANGYFFHTAAHLRSIIEEVTPRPELPDAIFKRLKDQDGPLVVVPPVFAAVVEQMLTIFDQLPHMRNTIFLSLDGEMDLRARAVIRRARNSYTGTVGMTQKVHWCGWTEDGVHHILFAHDRSQLAEALDLIPMITPERKAEALRTGLAHLPLVSIRPLTELTGTMAGLLNNHIGLALQAAGL